MGLGMDIGMKESHVYVHVHTYGQIAELDILNCIRKTSASTTQPIFLSKLGSRFSFYDMIARVPWGGGRRENKLEIRADIEIK